MSEVTFFVPGVPVAKGSAKAFYIEKIKRAVVVQDNAGRQKPWASAISSKAQEVCRFQESGPIGLDLTFLMPRPQAHYRTNGQLKPWAAASVPSGMPDCDKLARLALDSLTGIAFRDDAQVSDLHARKRYADGQPGVEVSVLYPGHDHAESSSVHEDGASVHADSSTDQLLLPQINALRRETSTFAYHRAGGGRRCQRFGGAA